jgi:hypothetical protein
MPARWNRQREGCRQFLQNRQRRCLPICSVQFTAWVTQVACRFRRGRVRRGQISGAGCKRFSWFGLGCSRSSGGGSVGRLILPACGKNCARGCPVGQFGTGSVSGRAYWPGKEREPWGKVRKESRSRQSSPGLVRRWPRTGRAGRARRWGDFGNFRKLNWIEFRLFLPNTKLRKYFSMFFGCYIDAVWSNSSPDGAVGNIVPPGGPAVCRI